MSRQLLPSASALLAALCLSATAPYAQTPATDSAVCVRCHALPSKKFHADPTHKKFDCVVCHTGAAAHVLDSKTRPVLSRDDQLCSGCHTLKPRK